MFNAQTSMKYDINMIWRDNKNMKYFLMINKDNWKWLRQFQPPSVYLVKYFFSSFTEWKKWSRNKKYENLKNEV